MDFIICIEMIGTYRKREYYRGFREWKFKLYNNWGIFVRLKRRIWGENDKIIKIAELKKVEQESKTIEEFV